ncbi:MAG: LPS assembly protein LptD [Phycisphaeraceae bacterium]|nr:MAG: LPS assembly protein LptD [Phycisphaeraceae bacterium]
MTRPTRRSSRPILSVRVLALAAGLAVSAAAGPAIGQGAKAGGDATEPNFGEIRLPVDLVVGDLALAARRAWVWRVAEARGPATIRIVLEGEVNTLLGPQELTAERASLWLRPRGVGGVGDASGIYEVFGYYEKVDSPGGPAAFGFSADKLPVQALVAAQSPVRLTVDLRTSGRPDAGSDVGAFEARAEQAFVEAMDAIRNPAAAHALEPEEPALQAPSWILNRTMPSAQPEEAIKPEDEEQHVEASPVPTGPRTRPGERTIPFTPGRAPTEREAARPPLPPEAPAVRPQAEPKPREESRSTPPSQQQTPSPPERGAVTPTPHGEQAAPPTEEPVQPAAETQSEGPVAQRIFSSTGVFFFQAGESATREHLDESTDAWTATGGVVVQFEGVDRAVELTARRAVLFVDRADGASSFGSAAASEVQGIYLEGGVRVSDGQYTLRSPRVYYDVRADRAILLDAVFRTYDARRNMPLYMRADVIRQEAAGKFSSKKAVYANTGFATPHLAVGTSRMTITERERADGSTGHVVDARNVTLRGAGVPFFWWPWFRGDPERFPLRAIGLNDTNQTGTAFKTSWDPFTLLGIEAPDGLSGTLDIDYYADRGFGLGTSLDWQTDRMNGGLLAYMLPDDRGTDVMPNGTKIARDGEFRGVAALKHRWQFRPDWTLWLNGFTASDEAFLPALFRETADNSEELTTRGYLRRLDGNSVLTLEAKGATTDFVPNSHAAQAPGYMVDKLPEIGYARIGDDLLGDWAPGWLTHTWSADLTRMRLRFAEITPADLGLRGASASQRAFAVNPGDRIADADRAIGLDESYVTRLDTRQELSTKFALGPVNVNPFVVGRVTAYDSRFDGFSPTERDQLRLWGSAGVNLSTSIYRIDDSVSSRTFDLNRMRHVIEPGVTLWTAGSTIDSADLPVYDDDVESLAEGSGVRVGVNQTWQTKRGAPGRWRNVDVFTLDAEYVWFSGDTNPETPIGRYFASRPELSVPQEFVRVAGTWQVTEVVGLAGETIWNVEQRHEDRNSLGLIIRHSEDLVARAELTRLDAQDDTYASGVLQGEFGDKYVYQLTGTYNFRLEDIQAITFQLLRRFPNGLLGGVITYNNISGETSFGLTLRPTGLSGTAFGRDSGGTRF